MVVLWPRAGLVAERRSIATRRRSPMRSQSARFPTPMPRRKSSYSGRNPIATPGIGGAARGCWTIVQLPATKTPPEKLELPASDEEGWRGSAGVVEPGAGVVVPLRRALAGDRLIGGRREVGGGGRLWRRFYVTMLVDKDDFAGLGRV